MPRLYRAALMVLAVALAGAVVGAAATARAQPQHRAAAGDEMTGRIVLLDPDLKP